MVSLTVIPFKKGLPMDTLSYFSALPIRVGDLVEVEIGSRIVPALVTELSPVSSMKLSVKKESFKMKKILRVIGPSPFAESIFSALEVCTRYFLTSRAALLGIMLPKVVIEACEHGEAREVRKSTQAMSERCVLQLPYPERKTLYRLLVREAFARNESFMIIVPTIIEGERIASDVARGIPEHMYVLHSGEAPKKTRAKIEAVLKSSHPVLIITTPTYAMIPRSDVQTIVIERESSEEYRTIDRNRYDWRVILENVAQALQIKLILSDTILRFETLYRHHIGELVELRPLVFTERDQKKFSIVGMAETTLLGKKAGFKIISELAERTIEKCLKRERKVFVLAQRKGLASTTICQDCGHLFSCSRCGSPLVLYKNARIKNQNSSSIKKAPERYFMCNRCRIVERNLFKCPYCKSWNLKEYGLGNERIIEELEKKFGESRVFSFDAKMLSTVRARQSLIKDFNKIKGGILVGTEHVIPYLTDIDSVLVVSIDSLFALSLYTVTEKVLRLIQVLRNLAKNECLIQTRSPDNIVLTSIERGAYLKIVRDDIRERQALNYNPFVTIVRFLFGAKIPPHEELTAFSAVREVNEFPFAEVVNRKYISGICIFVRIIAKEWLTIVHGRGGEHEKLMDLLLLLREESISTTINPEGILY